MPDVIHAIVTDEGEFGFSLTSPQLPGLVAIYDNEPTLRREYRQDIRSAARREGLEHSLQVIGHLQVRNETPTGQEYIVRWGTDDHEREERQRAGHLAIRVLHSGEGDKFIQDAQPDRTGTVVVVCCLATDTLGWVAAQLDDRGDAAVIAANVADEMLFATSLATKNLVDWPSLSEQGLSFNTTIGELMARKAEPRDAETLEHLSV